MRSHHPHPYRARRTRVRTRTVAALVVAGLAAGAVDSQTAGAAAATDVTHVVRMGGHIEIADVDDDRLCDKTIGDTKIVRDTAVFSIKRACRDVNAEIFFTVKVYAKYVDTSGWIKVYNEKKEVAWKPFAAGIPDGLNQQCGPVIIGQESHALARFDWVISAEPYREVSLGR